MTNIKTNMKVSFKNSAKRLLVSAASLSLVFSMASCMKVPSRNSQVNTSASDIVETMPAPVSSDNNTTETSTSVTSSETEDIKPTGIEDYVGETVVSVEPEITDDLFIIAQRVELGGLEFGFDNPDYCSELSSQLKMENAHLYDVGYLQDYYNKLDMFRYVYHSQEKDECLNFRRQISMYILENLGLRLYVDEIPYEFFEENFSDYLEVLKPTGDFDYDMCHGLDDVYGKFNDEQNNVIAGSISIEDFLSKVNVNDDKEMFRFLIFYSAMTYNQKRCSMVYDYHGTGEGDKYKSIYIKQVRTVDGKNVLLFKQYQYDSFLKDVHDQECYKNIEDLYASLTEDDLVKGGIDIDRFDYAIKEVAGINFDLENTKGGDSRARTS